MIPLIFLYQIAPHLIFSPLLLSFMTFRFNFSLLSSDFIFILFFGALYHEIHVFASLGSFCFYFEEDNSDLKKKFDFAVYNREYWPKRTKSNAYFEMWNPFEIELFEVFESSHIKEWWML